MTSSSFRLPRAGQHACVLAVALAAYWGIPNRASAIPSLTPHPHVNPGITDQDTTWLRVPEEVPDPDPDMPDQELHQHRDRDQLIGGNGKYIAYSVWDDNQYRLQEEFGHGHQANPARYMFDANVPAAARTDFDEAVRIWETAVNAQEVNVNGVPISIRINYERSAGAHEIDVHWVDLGPNPGCGPVAAIACWDPHITAFYFDQRPSRPIRPNGGNTLVGLTATGPFLPSVDHLSDNGWHFGGSGDQGTGGMIDYWQADAMGTITGPFVHTFVQYDFLTTALHEQGHSWGLGHFGTGIMREDISAFVMRVPDAGSIDGLKDLYAIPIPEPPTMMLALAAVLGAAGIRRTHARDATMLRSLRHSGSSR